VTNYSLQEIIFHPEFLEQRREQDGGVAKGSREERGRRGVKGSRRREQKRGGNTEDE